MSGEPEIIFERRGRAGLVTLNRPGALNALNRSMVDLMHPQLAAWAEDPAVELVVIRAIGGKAFCAGGDVRQLYELGRAGDPAARDFYREEYRLNAVVKRYPKPYVALVDGIVMGGGAGISIHGSHRVASERLSFAMPETGIGLFPDVGGTFFLPRLPGRIGTWLALTGARLGQADALRAGLATHAAPSGRFEDIAAALCRDGAPDAALAAYAGATTDEAPLEALMPAIDRCFSGDSVEEILARLEAETGAHRDWAGKQASILRGKSPTSLKIALRQMRVGAAADFETCMQIEFRIVSRVLRKAEFFEGVRAVIVDKDNAPQWRPARLTEISDADIDAYFAPLPDELDLPQRRT